MINKIIYGALLVIALFSCSDAVKKNPVTATDVGTTFIRAVLDNDFKTAEKYLLQEEVNQQYFKSFKQQYQTMPAAELESYKKADIIINTLNGLNDSTTIINYSNTYKTATRNNLKLLRRNGQWLIDLKYTFAQNQ